MDFADLVKSRHSAVNFVDTEKMNEQDFKQILDLTKLAPSAYNLQFAHYLIINDEAKKDIVYELSYRQYKIRSASAIVIVLGDKNAITQANVEAVYSPLKMLKVMNDTDYSSVLDMVRDFEKGLLKNPQALNQELTSNTFMSLAFFMLSAKYYGFDTCPMHVHHIPALRKYFNIPSHLEPLGLVAIGKSVDKHRTRGYRKTAGELATFNGFQ